jgi:hypothetical protein
MYSWIVFLHVLSVLAFMLAHGSAAGVMLQVRGERDPGRIHALLDLSQAVSPWVGITALLLLVFGVTAGFMGGWWRQGWIWTALALLIALSVTMTFMGRFYLDRVRRAIGVPSPEDVKAKVQPVALPPDQLLTVLRSGQPVALSVIGVVGLAVITWLMILKPF